MSQPEQRGLFDLAAGKARGEVGMQAAIEHAERVEHGWGADALDALVAAARATAGEFTIEHLRAQITGLAEPPDRRAWGSVTQRAIRAGYLVPTGRFAPTASGNGAPKPLYTLRGDQP